MKRRNGQNWLTQTNTNALILFSSKIKWDGVGNSQQGEAKKQKKLKKKKKKPNEMEQMVRQETIFLGWRVSFTTLH